MMKEVNASWKRTTNITLLMIECIREVNSSMEDISGRMLNLEQYVEEMTDIIGIRMQKDLQATDINCTVDDIECNTDELEGYLDNAFSQIENLKDNLKRLKKGE